MARWTLMLSPDPSFFFFLEQEWGRREGKCMQGTQNALSGAQLLKSKTSEKIKAPMRRRTQLGFGVGGKIEVTGVDVCRGSKHGGGRWGLSFGKRLPWASQVCIRSLERWQGLQVVAADECTNIDTSLHPESGHSWWVYKYRHVSPSRKKMLASVRSWLKQKPSSSAHPT